ncbi:MAG: thioredoxin family protein [Bacteroidales bacterium]
MKKIIVGFVFLLATVGFAMAEGYKIGDKVEDFNLKDVDGKYIGMKDFPDAKGFILVFSCNHCPYVKSNEERMIALSNEFQDKGYPLIAINAMNPSVYPDDSFENMVKNAEEKSFPFKYVIDEGQKVYPVYGATKTPEVFVVQRQGDNLVLMYHGAIDDNTENADKVKTHYTADAVNALLEGKEVPETKTKAIGCTIK